jgi:hypothetical protein
MTAGNGWFYLTELNTFHKSFIKQPPDSAAGSMTRSRRNYIRYVRKEKEANVQIYSQT